MTATAGRSSGSRFGWDVAVVAASRGIVRLAQFGSGIVSAWMLGPDGRGLVAALAVPAALALTFSEMGVRQATAYHLGRERVPLERLLPTLMTLVPLSSVLAIAASLLYYRLAGVAPDHPLLQALAVAVIPFSLFASYASGVLLGRQRIAAFSRAGWRPALISFALIVLSWLAGFGVVGSLVATLVGTAVSASYAGWLLSREMPLRFGFDREIALRLQRTGLTFAAALFLLTLNYRIIVLLLQQRGSLAQVGLYAQGMTIAELIWEMPAVLSALIFSRSVNAGSSDAFSRKVFVLARLVFLAATVAALALAVVAPVVLPLVYGSRFAGSVPVTLALLPGVIAFTVFKILNMDMAGRGKPWLSMVVVAPALVLNATLGWWLIGRHGAVGGAAAASVAYVAGTAAYVLLYTRTVGAPLTELVRFRTSDFAPIRAAIGRKRG